MKKLRFFLLPILAVNMILSFETNAQSSTDNAATSIAAASWLVGKWENQTARGKMSEEWIKKTDREYEGKSFVVVGKDTVSSEAIVLKQEGAEIYYIPTVKGQNNDQPVKFKLVSSSANQLVFENPAHDFPQKITYTLEAKDALVAEVSGLMNGQQRARKFPMKRVQ